MSRNSFSPATTARRGLRRFFRNSVQTAFRRFSPVFIGSVLLLLAACSDAPETARPPAVIQDKKPPIAAIAKKAPAFDWVFFYYMAYDNNLEKCGRPILDMLGEGITSDKVAVVVFADFRDKDGMRRYEQTKGHEKSVLLGTEASAEEATLQAQLDWTRANYKAKHYAIVFLDHGARLDEMSKDENPGAGSAKTWLKLPQTARILTDFRKAVGNKLEYIFIQQCGKGALENYYAMRAAAPFVMGSQTVIGAPNRYYTEALKAVCGNTEIDGKQLAHLFSAYETDNMFTTYTTVNEKALADLPKNLDAALKPLLELEILAAPAILPEFPRRGKAALIEGPSSVRMCFQPAKEEQFCDGLAWLKAMYEANKLDLKPYEAFAKWAREELITEHRCSPAKEAHAGTWCGFSIYVPANVTALERYADYAIYKDTKLYELMSRLLKSR